MTARAAWARGIIAEARRRGPVPRYGDDEWEALPPNDIRAVAAVVVAAEAWRVESEPDEIKLRLSIQVQALRAEREAHDAVEFAAMARQIRESANTPSFDELAQRRRHGAA